MNKPTDSTSQFKTQGTGKTRKFDGKTKRVFLVVVLSVVVVVLLAAGVWFFRLNDAKKQSEATLNAFITDIKEDKIADAYNLMSRDFRAKTPREIFALNFGDQAIRDAINNSYKQVSVEVPYNMQAQPVVIESEVTLNGDNIIIRAVFISEDGRWVIDSIVPVNG